MYAAKSLACNVITADVKTLKCDRHGRIKLNISHAQPVYIGDLTEDGLQREFDLLGIDAIRELREVHIVYCYFY